MKELVSLLPLLGIFALFWLMVIRPARRRQQQQNDLQAALQVGDSVMLTSGIFGTVERLETDRIGLRLTDHVVIEVAKAAVASRSVAEADKD